SQLLRQLDEAAERVREPRLSTSALAVDLASVGNPSHDHEPLGIVDRIHHSVVAHSNPVIVATRELHGARWPWVCRKTLDRFLDSIPERRVQPSKLPRCRRMNPDLVLAVGYSRTSA